MPESTPLPDSPRAGSAKDLLAKFATIRAASLEHLATLTDHDLDKRSHAPEDAGPFFSSVGSCYNAMAVHMAFHAGQLADARRAAGKQPLMA